jgi:hypothetical protein
LCAFYAFRWAKECNDAFLASCNESDREGISVEYLGGAHETFNYISFHPDNIGADGLPALQDGIQQVASVPSVTGKRKSRSEDSVAQQGGSDNAPAAMEIVATE